MLGITLSPEQIMQAPPEVRRWIEQQVGSAFGLSRPAPILEPPPRHLVGCNLEQVRAILSLIHGLLPVSGVFFELAQQPTAITQQGLHVLRLDEMQRNARLQAPEQVVACLGAIDEALRRVSGTPDVALSIVDGAGHCLVADETAQSILALWQELVSARAAMRPMAPVATVPEASPAPLFQTPYTMSVPASAIDASRQGEATA